MYEQVWNIGIGIVMALPVYFAFYGPSKSANGSW